MQAKDHFALMHSHTPSAIRFSPDPLELGRPVSVNLADVPDVRLFDSVRTFPSVKQCMYFTHCRWPLFEGQGSATILLCPRYQLSLKL